MQPSRLLLLLALGCSGAPTPTTDTGPEPCTTEAWFADADDDGWGDASVLTLSCEPVLNAVQQVGDCDDTDPLVHPEAPDLDCDRRDDNCDGVPDEGATLTDWYADQDGDGVGGSTAVQACTEPAGFSPWPGDCDDGDAEVLPGATERCNGIDDDCDGAVDPTELDGDGDGVAACTGDCDDADPDRAPGATEICNGADDDCDGQIPLDEFDLDSDGLSPCEGDCDDTNPLVSAASVELPADGVDGDCDGTELCFLDADGDGLGGLTHTVSLDLACDGPGESTTSQDCDDLDPLRSGGQPEVPWDGVDNDCDAATPDDDLDADGYPLAEDCDDLDPSNNPGNPPNTTFVDGTASAGLATLHWDTVANPLTTCPQRVMTGGAAAVDYDQDGWIDLFLPRVDAPDRLYRNNGDGTFSDVALASGIDHTGTTSMGLWLDVEADGDLDLLAISAGSEGNRLYINDGTGQFTDEAATRGVEMPVAIGVCSSLFGASAADIDGDGDLDLHIQEWHNIGGSGDRSLLFVNDGTGHFTDATVSAGLVIPDRAAFASSFGDVDGDGDLDLAMSADWGTSGLWLNDGTGQFTETTASAGVGLDENGMGSVLGDYDGDGDLDWFVSSIRDHDPLCSQGWGCTGNRLYTNDGTGSFTDSTDAAGVRDGAWGWAASFFDLDNDADLDLAHTNGFPNEWFDQDVLRLFVNDGTGSFEDQACEYGVDLAGQGKALVPFDADNDGDLDILTTLNNDIPHLFWNNGASDLSWLRVMASEPGNPFGVGVRVDIEAVLGGPVQRRDITANTHFVSQEPLDAHFGLADHEGALYEVRVSWPDGVVTVLSGVSPRQVLTVTR